LEESWARRSEGKNNSLYVCQTPIDEMVDDGEGLSNEKKKR